VLPTATATPVVSASPTPGPLTPVPTVAPGGLQQLPPVLFVMLDYFNGDWGNPAYEFSWLDANGGRHEQYGHPELGALGGWREFHWNDLNPGRGVYNWTEPDNYIRDAQAMRVTLPDGTVIPKPVGIAVVIATLDRNGTSIGTNHMPGWVGAEAGRTFGCSGSTSYCPNYCSPYYPNTVWQTRFDEFVLAMGRHYDSNPAFYNLTWVGVATGADEETVERKDTGGCTYASGSPAFTNWCIRVFATYNRAFPHIVHFIQPTVHGAHIAAEQAAAFAVKSSGIKVNGLEPDVSTAELKFNGVLVGGVTGAAEVWHEVIPTGYEPKRGNGVEGNYWFWMQGLSTHPVMFDVQLPNLLDTHIAEERTGFPILNFVRDHLGRTPADTPDVWIVLRDSGFQDSSYTGSDGVRRTYGPHHGDFEYWLYEKPTAPLSKTVARLAEEKVAELPAAALNHIYGWASVRRTDQRTGNYLVSFDVEDRYAARFTSWRVTFTVVNSPGTFTVQWLAADGSLAEAVVSKGAALGAANAWADVAVDMPDALFNNGLPGGVDFRIHSNGDGDEFVHRVIVTGRPGGAQ
jgi:hypothetical protein